MNRKLESLPKMGLVTLGIAACCVALPLTAQADLDTDPYLFTDQPVAATGQFEWDEFDALNGFGGPHPPDVASSGTGSAELTSEGIPQPMDGPPFGLVTSTQNLYSGGTLGFWDIDVTGASMDHPNTTVVLQVAALGELTHDDFLLNGTAPTRLVDRLVAPAVTHDIDTAQAEFDTRYYWAEWQTTADSDYTVEFAGSRTHLSMTAARVDYFNTADPFQAVAPGAVPEPTSLSLVVIGLALAGWAGWRRRQAI